MSNELKKWVRNCPNCNDEQSYSNKGNLTTAIKENRE